jgi:hypothetical protein
MAGGKAVMVWDVDVIEDVVLLELAITATVCICFDFKINRFSSGHDNASVMLSARAIPSRDETSSFPSYA